MSRVGSGATPGHAPEAKATAASTHTDASSQHRIGPTATAAVIDALDFAQYAAEVNLCRITCSQLHCLVPPLCSLIRYACVHVPGWSCCPNCLPTVRALLFCMVLPSLGTLRAFSSGATHGDRAESADRLRTQRVAVFDRASL